MGMVSVRQEVKANSTKLDNHELLIKANQSEIAAIQAQVKKLSSNDQAPTYANALSATSFPGPSAPLTTAADRQYDAARRSARLWPIAGSVDIELRRSVAVFLKFNLGLAESEDDWVTEVSRPAIPSSSLARNEIIVLFSSISIRDTVVGASGKLASFVDNAGKPTAGIRMEVSPALRTTFSALYKFGQHLRTRHGAQTRKHVKFDDLEKTLFLNIKLPGDEKWSRVSLEVAKRGLRTREALTNEALERRLDVAGQPALDRPRAASVSSMDTAPPATNPIAPSRLSRNSTAE